MLSELTGLHRNYIGQVERGTLHISVIRLVRIAQAFELPIGVLIDGPGPTAPDR